MSNNKNIRTALVAGISPFISSYPVKWPNKGIIKNGQPYTLADNPWLRCTILMGNDEQIGLEKTDKISGILQTDVFVKKGSGDIAAIDICDAIRVLMPVNGQYFESSGIRVKFEYHRLMAAEEESVWYRQSLESKFYAFVDRTI